MEDLQGKERTAVIKKFNEGWTVTVGCKVIYFDNIDKAFQEARLFLEHPITAIKKYAGG